MPPDRAATGERDQRRALSRAFLSRFFDNDITGGTNDLKAILFWLVAFLSSPGMAMPVIMMWDWTGIALMTGAEGLRLLSRTDKVFYLAFAMIASGGVVAVTWSSLLFDRRDATILGVLPVRGATIVRAKIVALFQYTALLAAAIHALPSFLFGWCLAVGSSMVFALHGIVAHFVAATAASAFVVFAVAAIQGTALAVLGPRRFDRVAPILQVGLVGLILLGLSLLPTMNEAVFATFKGSGVRNLPWILHTPPLWFLGLYEVVLGTRDPQLWRLASWAVGSLALVVGATLISYPLVYRRVAESTVQVSRRRTALGTSLSERATRVVSRIASVRASTQFFLSAIGRVERVRFVIATAIGISAGWMLPTMYFWLARSAHSQTPLAAPVGLSLATLLFVLTGLRIAAAVPVDLQASWMFTEIDSPSRALRCGLWRAMCLSGVVPVTLVFTPLYAWFWGASFALAHAALLVAVGVLVIEMLLYRFEDMPCALPWRPDGANLRARWPGYLLAFLLFTGGLAQLEIRLLPFPFAARAAFVAGLLVAAAGVRGAHRRQGRLIIEPLPETLEAPHVLDLT